MSDEGTVVRHSERSFIKPEYLQELLCEVKNLCNYVSEGDTRIGEDWESKNKN